MIDEEYGSSAGKWGQLIYPFWIIPKWSVKRKTLDASCFNFETTQVKEEFERIKALGGVVIKEPYEMGGGWIATLADPDGNYFQLVTPMG